MYSHNTGFAVKYLRAGRYQSMQAFPWFRKNGRKAQMKCWLPVFFFSEIQFRLQSVQVHPANCVKDVYNGM
jgi:hypothetical protein